MSEKFQHGKWSCTLVVTTVLGWMGERLLRILEDRGRMSAPKLASLVLLFATTSCCGPQFVYGHADTKHLQTHRAFFIDPVGNKNLTIWNMRPVFHEEFGNMVATQFRQIGYVQASAEEADLRVILSTFEDNSLAATHSISLVMEVVDRSSGQQLWSGHAELPWAEDSRGLSALKQCLDDFLKSLPARAH